MTSVTTPPSRQQAAEEVRRLRKPSDMTPQRWRSVVKLLRVVAKHYPRCCPSVTTLASEMKCSKRMAQYRIEWAVAAGVLAVEYDAGYSREGRINKTSQYHIAALKPDCMGARSDEDIAQEGSPSENYLTPFGSSSSDSVLPSVARKAAVAARGRHEEASRQVDGEPASPPGDLAPPRWDIKTEIDSVNTHGRKKRVVAQRKRPPSHTEQLVEYFQSEWKSLVDAQPRLVGLKAGAAGEIGRYIRTQLIDGKQGVEYTPEQIRSIIDDFMARVASGEITVRPGKPACRSFANHWKPLVQETTYADLEALRARNK